MSIRNLYSVVRPSLNLDFANTKALDPRITFARASNATFFDNLGILRTAAAGVARFDHNPVTVESLGFLVEEQRTNSIRNNTMVGAVAGTPGTLPTNWTSSLFAGITQQIVGTGTDNGITYIDWRISGTATGTSQILFETNIDVPASSGQAWSGAAYVKLQSGSLANITDAQMCIREGTSAGVFVRDEVANFTPTSAALSVSRRSVQIASTNASTQRVNLRIFVVHAGAIDITLRIGMPQLEQGAFATSVIPTTNAAATRAADAASMTGANFSSWYRQDEGTFVLNGIYSSIVAGLGMVRTDNGTDAMRIALAITGTTQRLTIIDNNSEVVDISRTGVTAGIGFFQAAAYKLNDCASVINGGAVGIDTVATIPTVTTLRFSASTNSGYPNGHIRRIAYYPQRLPNAQLQALTQI